MTESKQTVSKNGKAKSTKKPTIEKRQGIEKKKIKKSGVGKPTNIFDKFSRMVTTASGRPAAFVIAFAVIVVWAFTGPIFNYSDTWQLVINTGTTIITFLMVFIIQQSQNRDMIALHLKLNELIASGSKSSNRLVNIEDLTEEELHTLKSFYIQLANMSKSEQNLQVTHSIEEAGKIHKSKKVIK